MIDSTLNERGSRRTNECEADDGNWALKASGRQNCSHRVATLALWLSTLWSSVLLELFGGNVPVKEAVCTLTATELQPTRDGAAVCRFPGRHRRCIATETFKRRFTA